MRGALRFYYKSIQPFQKVELVASNEARCVCQVGRANRFRPEPQMRDRLRPRFMRVVNEIRLREHSSVFGYDLCTVLIGPNGPVSAEAIEDRAHLFIRLKRKAQVGRQARVGDIVDDARCKAVFRIAVLQFAVGRVAMTSE